MISLNYDDGEWFIAIVVSMFAHRGICFDFIKSYPKKTYTNEFSAMLEDGNEIYDTVMSSMASAVIVQSEFMLAMRLLFSYQVSSKNEKVWIMIAQMDFTSTSIQRNWPLHFIHGALSIVVHLSDFVGFQDFVRGKNPSTNQEDGFLKDFWEDVFQCAFPNSSGQKNFDGICTGEEKIETLPSSIFDMHMNSHSYTIYNAVYAVVHGLHALYSLKRKHKVLSDTSQLNFFCQESWQVSFSANLFDINCLPSLMSSSISKPLSSHVCCYLRISLSSSSLGTILLMYYWMFLRRTMDSGILKERLL